MTLLPLTRKLSWTRSWVHEPCPSSERRPASRAALTLLLPALPAKLDLSG